ncbi:MAG TPA: hypothetical protein VFL62_07095 [Bradyrhizobium sp.]|uniref:hypothetical protein n=1 Tax=Bradyrhizobium sp. TaxID=376 RepID=UPI002D81038C|nr:hypothetical protein [Bradyrhizobium sp.]HET7885974.1 hypothetical protein [Bradyrhizobium sp.]
MMTSRDDIATVSRGALVTRLPVLVVASWAVFYIPRIFQFGFYYDDWIFLVHWARLPFDEVLHNWWSLNAARPLAVLFSAILCKALPTDPHAWQAVNAALMLGTSLVLYSIFRVMAGTKNYCAAADIAAASWLLMPWMVGGSGWGVTFNGLVSVLLFALSLRCMMSAKLGVILAGALLNLASFLFYEPFVFGFVFAFLLLRFSLPPVGQAGPRLMSLILYGLGQVIGLALNRVLAATVATSAKPLNPQWLPYWIDSLRAIPRLLASSYPKNAILAALIVLLIVAVLGEFERSGSDRRRLALAFFPTPLILAAMLTGTLLYSLAGYGIIGTGYMSRTSIGISFWLAWGVFYAVTSANAWSGWLVLRNFAALRHRWGYVFGLPFLGLLAVSLADQHSIWAGASSAMKAVIDKAPTERLAGIPGDAIIIYVGPSSYRGLQFLGDVEMTSALFRQYPGLRKPLENAPAQPAPYLVPSLGQTIQHFAVQGVGLRFRWTGHELVEESPGFWSEKYPASQAWLWDFDHDVVRPVLPGETF